MIAIIIIIQPQQVHPNHQVVYHLLMMTSPLLKNNDRIQTILLHHGRTHILVQTL